MAQNHSNAQYEIIIYDNNGNRITSLAVADVSQFLRFGAVRSVGKVGALTIEFSGGKNQSSFFPLLERFGALRKDAIIEIWRTSNGFRSLLLDTVWYVRRVSRRMEPNGLQSVSVVAYDGLYLLQGRICINILEATQDTSVVYNFVPSAFMNELVRLNFQSSIGLWRQRNIPNFSVSAYSFNEPVVVSIDVGKANLLDALNVIASASAQQGYPLYFDVVCSGAQSMMFQVFANQRGKDRRNTIGDSPAVLIGTNSGAVRDLTVIADWTDELTAILPYSRNASGKEGFITNPYSVYSTPFSRRESIADAVNATTDELTSAAFAEIYQNRGSWNVSCTIQDTNDFSFGTDWGYGDRIYVNAFGAIVDSRIDSISVDVGEKQETIKIALNVTENII